MNLNAFGETIFLRLPRSYRVAEKSDPISYREPNCAVFQQITTVVQAQLAAPMDLSATNLASMNFNTLGETIFLRLPRSYRVAEKSDPIARLSGPDRRK